jgi:hypothetical protein
MMLVTDYKIMYVIISQVMFKNKTEVILIYWNFAESHQHMFLVRKDFAYRLC